jgi:2-polyprenyl-3-methyl-5-hydroxy-6-metoxy-1,4-benzoquinol methylase
VIAPADIPADFEEWNRNWHAPHGRALPSWWTTVRLPRRMTMRRRGPFAFQPNSGTRRFEYPWAFAQVAVGAGHTVVDVGGALSGFQFALASTGARVVNVDPFVDYGTAGEYTDRHPFEAISKLNAAFGTNVELRRAALPAAGLEAASVDVVYCISTLEHLPASDAEETMRHVTKVLRPGGRCVLTVDLFLDLAPFTSRQTNRWGANLDVRALVEGSGLDVAAGRTDELLGFPGFDADRIQCDLGTYLIGDYPGLAQCVTLTKPA